MEIKRTPAAHADTAENGLLSHTTNAAGFGEAITKEAEVSRHPAKMEGDARDTTADLARGPRADRRLDRRPGRLLQGVLLVFRTIRIFVWNADFIGDDQWKLSLERERQSSVPELTSK